MDRARVKIIVFPANIHLHQVNNYDESIYGENFSSLDQIQVNNVINGYSILYTADLFEQLDTALFIDNVIMMLTNALPKTIINIDITYLYIGEFSEDCGTAILNFDEFMTEVNNPLIEYNESPSVQHLLDSWDDDEMVFDISVCEECGESPCVCDDDEDEDDEDDDGPCERCGQPFCVCDDDEDEDDEDDDLPNSLRGFLNDSEGKMKKKSYGHSRVAKSSSKVKRNIKRHGVIISSDKDARKRDEKIIRAFLKDFIPGKERWIKEYREEILGRWIATFVISKKQAKRLAKAHREKYEKKNGRGKMTKEKAMELTRSFFQPDLWGDTNR